MGEPTQSNIQVPSTEYIGTEEETRGTETSKYPEEEKEKSIPKVAASEMGRAQTKEFTLWGCGYDHKGWK